MNGGTLALAFVAGTVATVNPCGFALLPAYLSYFLGLGGDDEDGPTGANPVLRALGVSAAVTLGFVVVFGLMGIIWSSVSGWLGNRLPYFTIVIGVGLVGLGIAMLRGFEPVVNIPKLQLSEKRREFASMFLYGVSYAIASLSCTIGVFLAVTSTTLTNSGFLQGVSTFVAYGLGMGATLAVLTLAVALAKQGLVTRFRKLLPYMGRVSGVLLVLAGVFVAYYAYVEIQELNGNGSSGLVQWVRDIQSSLQRWAEQMGAVRLLLGAALIIGAAVITSVLLRSNRRNHETAPGADPAVDEPSDGGSPRAKGPLSG
ncbi:MAG: cytochrome c biogenesis CcdA family protein [Microthrixaceae bacterium]|nr:cytochrome c biogenesis protein CcdA [Microthrixaceae bacterium]MCB1010320.1 cytochrome c biogenesis protein CcdA [Microthrixaceae bacterium]MCO5320674.1 cytochrome c biogenesis CcdA family protein [Microthrixaceae bacterium]